MKENYSFDINIYVSSTDIYQWWQNRYESEYGVAPFTIMLEVQSGSSRSMEGTVSCKNIRRCLES